MKKKNFNCSALILCCCSMMSLGCGSNDPAPQDEGEPSVRAQTPVTITFIRRDTMMHEVQVNATSTFLLKSFSKANATGYLQTSNVHLGQLVRSGQVLFTIRTKESQTIGDAINSLDTSFRFSGSNTIRAGANGYISQLDHQAGDYVQDGEQLAVVSNANSFVFLMNMPYELRPLIMKQKQVRLELPDGEAMQGTISSVLPVVDSAAQTIPVVIKTAVHHPIPENLVARASIRTSYNPSALTLPASAVLSDETQTEFWVMKMTDSVTAIKIPVQKGNTGGGRIEILSPRFSPHDSILLTGNYGLEDTAMVKITGVIQ